MAKYRFYAPADRRQDEIWDYSAKTWGLAQAETYLRGLHDFLARLAATPALWRELPSRLAVPADLQVKVYFARYERHVVFFRELSGKRIGILTILHAAMDLPVRLNEDLAQLERLGD